jgi:hypothetical protein
LVSFLKQLNFDEIFALLFKLFPIQIFFQKLKFFIQFKAFPAFLLNQVASSTSFDFIALHHAGRWMHLTSLF